jgi:hypothetical protein
MAMASKQPDLFGAAVDGAISERGLGGIFAEPPKQVDAYLLSGK